MRWQLAHRKSDGGAEDRSGVDVLAPRWSSPIRLGNALAGRRVGSRKKLLEGLKSPATLQIDDGELEPTSVCVVAASLATFSVSGFCRF